MAMSTLALAQQPTRFVPSQAELTLETYVQPGTPAPNYVRRRLVAALVVAVAVVAVVLAVTTFASGALGDVPASGPEGAGAPSRTYVVQPGDTIWSIATRLHPQGGVAALLKQISDANGGTSLQAGQSLVIP